MNLTQPDICKGTSEARKCLICGENHPAPPGFMELSQEDLCPRTEELNSRLLAECLNPSYTHPHWTDPRWVTDVAPLVELRSYHDYLTRRAFSGSLSSRSNCHLKRRILRKGKGGGGLAHIEKVNKIRDTIQMRKRSSLLWYNHMKGMWTARGYGCLITEPEWEFIFHSVLISPPGLPIPWVGTLWEYMRPKDQGGLERNVRWERLDPSRPISLENLKGIFEMIYPLSVQRGFQKKEVKVKGRRGAMLVDGDSCRELWNLHLESVNPS